MFFSFPGRCFASGLHKASAALHELNNLLHRLPVPPASRLSILIPGLQVDPEDLPACQGLPVLGVHGPERAPHQLPQRAEIRVTHPLPAARLPLERLPLSSGQYPTAIEGKAGVNQKVQRKLFFIAQSAPIELV